MNKAFITVTPDTGQNNGTLSVNADKMNLLQRLFLILKMKVQYYLL